MLKKVSLLLSTVRHLKLIQVKYQLIYRLKKPGTLKDYGKDYDNDVVSSLNFLLNPPVYKTAEANGLFKFLNLKVDFKNGIDWDYQQHGKLWNYNLQYCNYLLQEDLANNYKEELLNSLYSWLYDGKLGLEPYPASLRIINVIRFYSKFEKSNSEVLRNVYAELDFLSQRPEYHLLGNHLLENAFALMMGGAFFSKSKWIDQGTKILKQELDEQILTDGGHFELSPMYHQIIFFRLLELIDWYSSFNKKDVEFERFIGEKAGLMFHWLKEMTFSNGDIPHFNDSANDISYSTSWLLDYAKGLKIISAGNVVLNKSGYRVYASSNYKCIVDVGPIGPSYQPGHGHSDALSFILYKDNKPLFVEQGTSTYQIGKRRSQERSTSAHNTAVINNKNQSEVWGGFRVGKRAAVKILKEEERIISAIHDGYSSSGIIHQREFEFLSHQLLITDDVKARNDQHSVAYFHLHPNVEVELVNKEVVLKNHGSMEFTGAVGISIEDYEMAAGYNNYVVGKRIIVNFVTHLKTNIRFSRT